MPIDATLGVPGHPQSGTGQTALLTGLNAPELFGRHFGPWVPTPLRAALADENLFARALRSGRSVAFANAYPAGFMEPGGRGVRRPGAFPFAARSAGVLTRDEADLRAGTALVSSITTEGWRRHVDPALPDVALPAAGRSLAAIARRNELTVFAHYDTDYMGHRGDLGECVTAIERVDDFLGGLLEALSTDILLVLTSDHGNLEDVTTGHTRNAVPLIASGPGAGALISRACTVTDVSPLILKVLERMSPTYG
ncbi:MAG: alkaline phosphatase family protein [Gemmatimonadota bacterium]